MLDREATASVMNHAFAVAMRLETAYYEEQMTTGQCFSFTVEACDGFVALKYAGVTLWSTENWSDSGLLEKNIENIEREARKTLAELIETVKTMEGCG